MTLTAQNFRVHTQKNETVEHGQTHLVVLGELEEGQFFGWEFGREKSQISVVTNKRVELLMIPKDDIFRFATDQTWAMFEKQAQDLHLGDLRNSYEKQLQWMDIKKDLLAFSTGNNWLV